MLVLVVVYVVWIIVVVVHVVWIIVVVVHVSAGGGVCGVNSAGGDSNLEMDYIF